MIPYTLVLKPGLVIHRVYNGYWFWGARPSTADLWHDPRHARSAPTGTQAPRTPRGLERRRLVGLPWAEQVAKKA